MAIDGGEHRAHCAQGADGKWSGGCEMCGTRFGGAEQLGAESWVAGHDSAVVSAGRVAEKIGPLFPKAGPGDATTVDELRETLDWLADSGAEIVQPMDQVPVLYLWTAPTEEGWNREPIGAIYLDRGAQFVPVADPDAVAAD